MIKLYNDEFLLSLKPKEAIPNSFGMPLLVLEREEREISYKYYLFFLLNIIIIIP